jgi:SAM-dependent methyltransferase
MGHDERVPARGGADPTARVVESQKRFYDLRAPDYLTGAPSDRRGTRPDRGVPAATRRLLVGELRPMGAVLELGCGPGGFTRELARHAQRVVAVDSSPQMLARNRREVSAANVSHIEADVFDWEPSDTYDLVFFGFLLSHVPPSLFERFWRLVDRCLRADGRVAFVDEDDRIAQVDDVRMAEGIPVASRKLADGQEFDIVKVFWKPRELATRLEELGWDIEIRPIGTSFIFGTGAMRDAGRRG